MRIAVVNVCIPKTQISTLLLMIATVGLTFGCSTYKVRPMPMMGALDAPSRTSMASVDIGAKALTDKTELKATFNYDMLSKGILPIHLAVDNHSAREIELVRARIELVTASGQALEPINPGAASTGEGRNAMAEAIFFFGIFSYDNANKYNDDLQRDWAEKGMGEVQLVRPGRVMNRFLYFNVGSGFSPSGSTLSVPFQIEGAGDRLTAALRLD